VTADCTFGGAGSAGVGDVDDDDEHAALAASNRAAARRATPDPLNMIFLLQLDEARTVSNSPSVHINCLKAIRGNCHRTRVPDYVSTTQR
jgi:hypothetical protein